jgi:RNA polymerase sigma-70 factor (family 1)
MPADTPNTNSFSDEQLLAGLRAGREEAFTLLWKRFYQRVLYFSRRYVEEADAQDITAEAFIQLWKNKEGFDEVGKVLNFLFVAARNRCYNLIRDQRTRGEHVAELTLLMTDDAGDLFTQQVRVELVKLIRDRLYLLPEKMREVFLLSFEEGLKPAQIAARLGISVKTVKNQKLSAINLLKAALAGHPLEVMLVLLLTMDSVFPTA